MALIAQGVKKKANNVKQVTSYCYFWSTALYVAKTWTLQTVDEKHLESFELWCWRRLEKINWTNHAKNEI